MEPPKIRRRLSPEGRRAQLLGCAITVAARRGLGRTVHTEIAREAGVATPTIFSYFPTRRDLLIGIITEVDRYYIALGDTCHRSARTPLDAVRGHFEGFVLSIDQNPEYAQVWMEWSSMVRNEDGLWDAFLDFQERVIKMVTGSLRRGQRDGTLPRQLSAADAARLIVASSYAAAQLKFMQRSPRVIQHYIDQVLDMALK